MDTHNPIVILEYFLGELNVVKVKSSKGKVLMPCEPVIARLLLKSGKAKVINTNPFVIKLNYEPTTQYIQDLTMGMDTGSGRLATAVISEDTDELLYASEVQTRNDIAETMTARSKLRRTRRSRKTRYRAAKFLQQPGTASHMISALSAQHGMQLI
jgi:hypothetical protein